MKNTNLEAWLKDVKKTLTTLKIKIDENPTSKALYGGFYIWDSKCVKNPEIMFIGINPGNGNPANNGQIITDESHQFSYMEYLDGENNTYTLARETIQAFEMAGYNTQEIRNLLNEKSIKTNFYYLITTNQPDIKKCLNGVNDYTFSDFWKQSYKWTLELIDIMNPKVVICEGKSVFDEIKENDIYTDLKWSNDCGYLIRPNGQIIIGYNRVFSNIKNKEEFSNLIARFVKKESVQSTSI